MHPAIPEKPSLDGLGDKWSARWEADQTYRFDRSATRDQVYSIDTPPPTVSGSLHLGHVFSFTQTDVLARYHRMTGKAVFYPMGWDDNGLPTERRAQNVFGVRCDPTLAYDPAEATPGTLDNPAKGKDSKKVSRRRFIELCQQLTAYDERHFEEVWRAAGLSVDWSLNYQTIGDRARAVAQRFFLRNIERGEAYLAEAPTLWDVTFQTAVAQAEVEFRDGDSTFYDLRFEGPSGPLTVATTRPELLPACVALVAHPDDERYQSLFGSVVRIPLWKAEVPVMPHKDADPAVGTGLVMVCTFGDLTDVTWWRDLALPIRAIVGRDGRLLPDAPSGMDSERYAAVAGLTVKAARRETVRMLREEGLLLAERPVRHAVKYYEKGDLPLEIVTSRQWYITNGGRDDGLRDEMLRRGEALNWYPPHMRGRYESWARGLTGDWLISRQRYFGVPIPVWYPLDEQGEPRYDTPLLPAEGRLPVDPRAETPDGYAPEQRDRPGGFTADPDVMDTWATSSLSPVIAAGDLLDQVFPMDLRPQAHEIIRTWLYTTVLRSHLEYDELPWKNAVISGWVLADDKSKMSKSFLSKSGASVSTPLGAIAEYGPDAVRYWAASGRPGVDIALSPEQMRIGRRLAVKLLNASRFVLSFPASASDAPVTAPLDLAMLARLSSVVATATSAFEAYDYPGALSTVERFFWEFCDDYLELAKPRAYSGSSSAVDAMRTALDTLLRLFAPFLPFVTEEIWSWWRTGSVHLAPWPVLTVASSDGASTVASSDGALTVASSDGALTVASSDGALTVASEVIAAVRRAKSEARLSQRAPASAVTVTGPAASLDALRLVADDLREAGQIGSLSLAASGGSLAITVTL
ncbi:MAG: valine--tRNA ligase [Hamadaea sp.]|uniref:valine--tRNA ligase n=1 Tax=Hamadaea sp. TaxID=2024425 RepID=UPI0018087475|nr:valine--tRNA ligase [Hamadaea sp.]NUT19138.1 valine--tRNA ligase [Hamadaea sp.]